MKFEKALCVQAPVEKVWQFLWDVDRVKSCIPVCRSVRVVEPRKLYEATVEDKIGPFRVSFNIQVNVIQVEEQRRIQIKGSGKDARIASHATGSADVWISPCDQGTEIRVVSDVNILGKLGSLGQSIIVRKADEYMTIVTDLVKRQLEGMPADPIGVLPVK